MDLKAYTLRKTKDKAARLSKGLYSLSLKYEDDEVKSDRFKHLASEVLEVELELENELKRILYFKPDKGE